MVASAQETSVRNLGLAAVQPVDQVMAITPSGWAVATRESAVLITSGERAQHRRRARTGAAADAAWLPPAVSHDPGHGALPPAAPGHSGADRPAPIALNRRPTQL